MSFNFILALFFIVLGLFGMILPLSPTIRTEVVDFLLSNTITLFIFGFALVTMGILVLVQVLQRRKRRYFTRHQKALDIDVSEKVIHDYLSVYFRDLFPHTDVPCQIILKKKKAKILADLPFIPKEEQYDFLKKIESDLSDIFRELIGYPHELLISISFAQDKK